jgi:hypothetical protein
MGKQAPVSGRLGMIISSSAGRIWAGPDRQSALRRGLRRPVGRTIDAQSDPGHTRGRRGWQEPLRPRSVPAYCSRAWRGGRRHPRGLGLAAPTTARRLCLSRPDTSPYPGVGDSATFSAACRLYIAFQERRIAVLPLCPWRYPGTGRGRHPEPHHSLPARVNRSSDHPPGSRARDLRIVCRHQHSR